MKIKNQMKCLSVLAVAAAAALAGCGGGGGGSDAIAQSSDLVQIERLARPGINELLVFSDPMHRLFNQVPPTADLSDGAAGVRAEAVATLTNLSNLGGGRVDVGAIAGAFLPDVMRVNTALSVPVAGASYGAALNAVGSPVGGRKLTDDVIDISYLVLTGISGATDGVNYYAGGSCAASAALSHQCLRGQTVPNGPAVFPFVAPAR